MVCWYGSGMADVLEALGEWQMVLTGNLQDEGAGLKQTVAIPLPFCVYSSPFILHFATLLPSHST